MLAQAGLLQAFKWQKVTRFEKQSHAKNGGDYFLIYLYSTANVQQ